MTSGKKSSQTEMRGTKKFVLLGMSKLCVSAQGEGRVFGKKSGNSLCSTVWQPVKHTLTLSRHAPVSRTDTFPLWPCLNHGCPLQQLTSGWRRGAVEEGGGAQHAGEESSVDTDRTVTMRLRRSAALGAARLQLSGAVLCLPVPSAD